MTQLCVGLYGGIAIALAASVLINLGTNLLKLGHLRVEEFSSAIYHNPSPKYSNGLMPCSSTAQVPSMYLNRRPSVFKTWQWQTGFALFLLGNAATLGALSVIPVSLLSALASVQFVSNTLFTTCALKEKASRNTWVGCALITLALCCIVVFGSHDTKEYTSEELQRNYGNTGVIVYLCCALLALPIAHMLYENCKA
eukprot:gene28731-35656_t